MHFLKIYKPLLSRFFNNSPIGQNSKAFVEYGHNLFFELSQDKKRVKEILALQKTNSK